MVALVALVALVTLVSFFSLFSLVALGAFVQTGGYPGLTFVEGDFPSIIDDVDTDAGYGGVADSRIAGLALLAVGGCGTDRQPGAVALDERLTVEGPVVFTVFAEDDAQMYVIGLHTDLSRFNALHTGMEIVSKAQRVNEVTAISREGFTLFNLDQSDAVAVEQFPPLSAPFGEARISDGIQTLFGARLGNIDTRQPLMAAAVQGERRRVFVWGEGLWRWRLADFANSGSHDRFDRLVQQLAGFAAMQADRQRLRVEADRTYQTGMPIVLRALLYNESYELSNTVEVSLELKGDEYSGTFTFHSDGDAYSLVLPTLPEGVYRYRATTADGLVAEGTFAVEALGLELSRLVADHSLLRTISHTTGGTIYTPDDISALKHKLAELKPTIYSHTRYSDLLGLPLVLALIVLLLGAEWLIRKLSGEV